VDYEGSRELPRTESHHFSALLPDDPDYLDANPTRLIQIVQNLLNNAASTFMELVPSAFLCRSLSELDHHCGGRSGQRADSRVWKLCRADRHLTIAYSALSLLPQRRNG
jgi:hypothetical protein